ncbi:pre-toxin TG domain-containing protein [Oligoflexus tunisiensis]|uniref:pre-toxin TG domain-containing protein n=1 Tax=Oligoflexus tunisiensis TaxID=708132 RepID=UPI00159F2503|nr:pre-toxin TG domain-containing protein [Oligoflexus tunisiensis]
MRLYFTIFLLALVGCMPLKDSVSNLKDLNCPNGTIPIDSPSGMVCSGPIIYIDPKTGQLKAGNVVAVITQGVEQDLTKDEVMLAAIGPYLPPQYEGWIYAIRAKAYRDACKKVQGDIAVLEQEAGELAKGTNEALGSLQTEQGGLEKSASQSGFGQRDAFAGEVGAFEQQSSQQLSTFSGLIPPPEDIPANGQTPEQLFPEQAKCEMGQNLVDHAEQKVEEFKNQPDYEVRKGLVGVAKSAIEGARTSYQEGKIAQGDALYSVATTAADIALSLNPVTAFGKDLYEAWTGRNALTGQPLTKFERTLAYVGVFTGGVGSKIALAVKLGAFIKIGKGMDELAEAERFIRSAESLGIKGPVDVKSFSDVANKMGKSPEDLAEAVKSGKGLIGRDFEEHLASKLGGQPSFKMGGREFDGKVGNAWFEAKTGAYWDKLDTPNNPTLADFKSDMGSRLSIAQNNGASYHLISNTPIRQDAKDYLIKKGITYVDLWR